jgi:hypothetical protein
MKITSKKVSWCQKVEGMKKTNRKVFGQNIERESQK